SASHAEQISHDKWAAAVGLSPPVRERPAVLALTNGRLILPDRIQTGKAVIVRGSRIEAIVDEGPLAPTMSVDVGGRYIAPGLIDIHIHGASGHTFNEPTLGAYEAICLRTAAAGVTGVLATLASAPLPDLLRCLCTTAEWISHRGDGSQILGAHLEGPY